MVNWWDGRYASEGKTARCRNRGAVLECMKMHDCPSKLTGWLVKWYVSLLQHSVTWLQIKSIGKWVEYKSCVNDWDSIWAVCKCCCPFKQHLLRGTYTLFRFYNQLLPLSSGCLILHCTWMQGFSMSCQQDRTDETPCCQRCKSVYRTWGWPVRTTGGSQTTRLRELRMVQATWRGLCI